MNEENKSETTYPTAIIQENKLILSIEKEGKTIQSIKTFSKNDNTKINFVEEEIKKIVITHE